MLVFTSEKVFKGQKMKWRFTKKSVEFCLKREKMTFPVPPCCWCQILRNSNKQWSSGGAPQYLSQFLTRLPFRVSRYRDENKSYTSSDVSFGNEKLDIGYNGG